jgi:GMP synthase-like glutamine amidotransferase
MANSIISSSSAVVPLTYSDKKGVIIDNTGTNEGPKRLQYFFKKNFFKITETIKCEEFNSCYEDTYLRIKEFDFVVLSGSSNYSAHGRMLRGVRQFIIDIIKERDMPIFGVCLGHQIIASALSVEGVVDMFPDMKGKWNPELCRKGSMPIEKGIIPTLDSGSLHFKHGYYVSVDKLCPDFQVLQTCKDETDISYVFFMKHTAKQIFSTQGHPEWSDKSIGRDLVHHVFSEWFKDESQG